MAMVFGWCIFLMSVIGHTEWWVMAVNRSHALKIRAGTLRKFRSVHDVAVLLYPFLLLTLTGLGPDSLLRGGDWSSQTPLTRQVVFWTSLGIIPLLLGILRWQLFRRHEFRAADERAHHDVQRSAGTTSPPTTDEAADVRGPRPHLLRKVPGNEILNLEVNSKRVQISRNGHHSREPKSPLRIVHFSDLHFIGCPGEAYYRFVAQEVERLQPDLILFTGDLIDQEDLLSLAIDIWKPLTTIAPCYFILGNHDWRYDFERIRSEFSKSGWVCVTGRLEEVEVKGRRILVGGSEMPWMGQWPPQVRETVADLKLLLCHSPDHHRWARRAGYDLMLSGHTHGGQVVLPVIGPVYSPSLYGVSYVSGLFSLGSLTLHVSRGIGAKDPLRLRCPPELTCLNVEC